MVVVQWLACLPSSPTIWVQVLLKPNTTLIGVTAQINAPPTQHWIYFIRPSKTSWRLIFCLKKWHDGLPLKAWQQPVKIFERGKCPYLFIFIFILTSLYFSFFKGPTPASFCLFSFFSNANFTEKNSRLQQDLNLDRQSRRGACWPLDHHHGPFFFSSFSVFASFTRKNFCVLYPEKVTLGEGSLCRWSPVLNGLNYNWKEAYLVVGAGCIKLILQKTN